MRSSSPNNASGAAAQRARYAAGSAPPPLTGADLMLSMVEARAAVNGNGNGMDSRSQQELDQIEAQITKLQGVAHDEDSLREIKQLHQRIDALRNQVSGHSTAWQKTELARHPQRPYTLDYIERIFTDWSEIHGDRRFRDDPAIVCGMARLYGQE